MMSEGTDERVRTALAAARTELEPAAGGWSAEARETWARALDSIESCLNGDTEAQGFSIIRSLDVAGDVDSPMARAFIRLAAALSDAGVDRYR